ncbi:hypothetical protein jhhlp_001686 [Lomentospora prolificans]|uniref:cellulase n=1 Tax=Lomentospora prolificans TaxID=41688 RepID=A0A2N3NGZ6_9PEZI|nr:hypothetical protein jhhlp_001686 [Lomentospora prolificans]
MGNSFLVEKNTLGSKMKSVLVASLAAWGAYAQSGAWGQCGGNGWTGATTCVAGYTCTYQNDWYSQCLPGAAVPTTTTKAGTTLTTTTRAATSTAPGNGGSKKFKWFGVNQSVGEFGQGAYPGVWGKDFYFPDPNTISTLISQGYNTFRVAFSMERMAVTSLSGAFDTGYLTNYTNTINHITSNGAYAVLDPHNYGRYYDNVITNTNDFKAFWVRLANHFKGNDKVIFDTNNEYHTMESSNVLALNQAAIDGIRSTGATNYIFVEGNQWSGAWSWTSVNTNLVSLTDPLNKIVYEMHQYLDSDSSGTSDVCVSSTIGVERVTAATQWLRQNGKLGFLGEFAGGANNNCKQAVTGMLNYLQDNSDVWLGALWWAAGPWWGNYIYSFEPPSGTGYQYYNSVLQPYTV